MNRVPNEVLLAILSQLEIWQLFEMRQVCIRWQQMIDNHDDIWRNKKIITKRDLGLYLSPESQVNRLVYLFMKLPTIEHYSFPVLLRLPNVFITLTKGLEMSFLRLYHVLKKLFNDGRIPLHLDAINFMENMIESLRCKESSNRKDCLSRWKVKLFAPSVFESQCSISKCTTIIVPIWPPDKQHDFSYNRWISHLVREMKPNLKEIVIEQLLISSYNGGAVKLDQLMVKIGSIAYTPSTIRVLTVTGELWVFSVERFIPSVHLRAGRELFAFDEFSRLMRPLRGQSAITSWCLLLNELRLAGRIQDCHFGCSDGRIDVKELLTCLQPKPVTNALHEPNMILYHELLQETAKCQSMTHLSVKIDVTDPSEHPPSQRLSFLRHDPFREVTRLDLDLNCGEPSDARLMSTWDCLLQKDILARLEVLRVDFNVLKFGEGSRVLTAPVPRLSLPRLESLELNAPRHMAYVRCLLHGAPNLRHLSLFITGLDDSHSQQEHVAFRDQLLSSIHQLKSIVSLNIHVNEPEDCQRNWIVPWLVNAQYPRRYERFHLVEEVFDAFSGLFSLDMLTLDFRASVSSEYYVCSIDMHRLAAMLPRLHAIKLTGHEFEEC